MRIAAGQFKGRVLVVPRHIRATESKVRQALFNVLGDIIVGARVIDGFAGSGALGIEALSRGASFVAFIESNAEVVVSLQENLARLGSELERSAWRLVQLDVERALAVLAKVEASFDVVLLDPPYSTDEGKKALISVVECAMLAPTGVVVVEHDQRTEVPSVVGLLREHKQHRYGDTVLSFYRLAR